MLLSPFNQSRCVYTVSHALISDETLVPFRRALSRARAHNGSSMRIVRTLVPLPGIVFHQLPL